MEVTHQPYQTVPLDSKTSTRLLTLHHGSGEDAIKCSLTTVDLETEPRYNALSYCWGSSDNAKQLLLDEHFVDVRENLWSALWHLRLPKGNRILWVDALCINQSDFLERNHQVGLMSTVYSIAEEVIVWLGPASEDSDVGMKWLSRIHWDKSPTLEESQGAIKLCEREYWHRMWVLQELVLAGDMTVHCGSKCVHWMAFAAYSRWNAMEDLLKMVNGVDYTAIHSVISYRQYQLAGKFDKNTLLVLLAAFNDRQCVDPRDTVFALLGMASDCRDLDLTICPHRRLLSDALQRVHECIQIFLWASVTRWAAVGRMGTV